MQPFLNLIIVGVNVTSREPSPCVRPPSRSGIRLERRLRHSSRRLNAIRTCRVYISVVRTRRDGVPSQLQTLVERALQRESAHRCRSVLANPQRGGSAFAFALSVRRRDYNLAASFGQGGVKLHGLACSSRSFLLLVAQIHLVINVAAQRLSALCRGRHGEADLSGGAAVAETCLQVAHLCRCTLVDVRQNVEAGYLLHSSELSAKRERSALHVHLVERRREVRLHRSPVALAGGGVDGSRLRPSSLKTLHYRISRCRPAREPVRRRWLRETEPGLPTCASFVWCRFS